MTEPGQPAVDGREAPVFERKAVEELLRFGELDVIGRLVDASNATLYCEVSLGTLAARCVHKPVAGERPLVGLPGRHPRGPRGGDVRRVRVLGLGPGPAHRAAGRPVRTRDVPALGRRRRGGGPVPCWREATTRTWPGWSSSTPWSTTPTGREVTCCPRQDGRVQAIDHGVTFSVDDKLRTLLWQWRDSRLPDEAFEVLHRLDERAGRSARGTARHRPARAPDPPEVKRTRARVRRLLRSGCYPLPSGDWPPVPWPPF